MIDVHPRRKRSYKRSSNSNRPDWRGQHSPSLWILLVLMLTCGADGENYVSCCSGSYAVIDCTTPTNYKEQQYICKVISPRRAEACSSCLKSELMPPDMKCSACCGKEEDKCEAYWSWGAVLATLSVSTIFATCSGLLALTEKRRKRKGISLARAWSIPQGMPILRATVIDLSDAVRRRSSFCSTDVEEVRTGTAGDHELEHARLLEEIPSDSIYGALSQQGDDDIPVATATSEGVTAEAWHASNSGTFYEEQEEQESTSRASLSRWRSARAIARQARRLAAAATAHRDSHLEEDAWSRYSFQQEALLALEARQPPTADEDATVEVLPPLAREDLPSQ